MLHFTHITSQLLTKGNRVLPFFLIHIHINVFLPSLILFFTPGFFSFALDYQLLLCLAPEAADVSPHTHRAALQTIAVDLASGKVLKRQRRAAAGLVYVVMATDHAAVPRHAAIDTHHLRIQ